MLILSDGTHFSSSLERWYASSSPEYVSSFMCIFSCRLHTTGSGNDFARGIGLSRDPEKALETILATKEPQK